MNASASAMRITVRRPMRIARSLPSLIAFRSVDFPKPYIFDMPFRLVALTGRLSDVFTISVNLRVLPRRCAVCIEPLAQRCDNRRSIAKREDGEKSREFFPGNGTWGGEKSGLILSVLCHSRFSAKFRRTMKTTFQCWAEGRA